MSAARNLSLFRAFAHIGTTEAIAYRTEALLWLLSGTMPLVMIAFFGAVTREGPIGRYDKRSVVAYFLATFIVRNLTASWISWQVNLEIRDGTLSGRLLLPVHPLLAYTAESLGAMPVRIAGSVAMGAVMLVALSSGSLSHDPTLWILWVVSIFFSWLLSLFVSVTIGALAFFIDSSAKIMDAWLAGLFVFSGYVVPVDLFPPGLRAIVDWLPFRYQIGLPVELMVGAHDRPTALLLVGRQLAFVAAGGAVTLLVWRRGLSRFSAHGG